MKKNRKKQPQNQRKIGALSGTLMLPIDSIYGIHPSVPAELYTNLNYFSNDLGVVTLAALEILMRSHPIGVVPTIPAGKFQLIAGLRSWQFYQAAISRSLIQLSFIPAVVYPEATDANQIEEIARAETYLTAELFAIEPSQGHAQLHALQTKIPESRWEELFGKRTRLQAPPILIEKPPLPGVPTGKPGRPRVHPLRDPSAPKRRRGRPSKSAVLAVPTAPPDSPLSH